MVHVYVVCPICFANRPISPLRGVGDGFPLGDYDGLLVDTPIIQLREALPGPGRGHREKGTGGFQVVGTLSLADALGDPELEGLAIQMKDRLVMMVREYVKAGFIDKAELDV